jgi:Bacterial regulatory proteins, luxR family
MPRNGRRNREIALQLNLTEHTVRNYLIRIFDKLGISSRVELVLYAFSGTEGNATPENPKNILCFRVNKDFVTEKFPLGLYSLRHCMTPGKRPP